VLPEEGYGSHDDGENASADFRHQRSDIESGQQDKAKFPSSGTPSYEYTLLLLRVDMFTICENGLLINTDILTILDQITPNILLKWIILKLY